MAWPLPFHLHRLTRPSPFEQRPRSSQVAGNRAGHRLGCHVTRDTSTDSHLIAELLKLAFIACYIVLRCKAIMNAVIVLE